MAEKKLKRIYRRTTPEERARDAEVRKLIEAEKPAIEAETTLMLARYEASLLRHLRKRNVFDLPATVASLKSARQEQGLSLAEIGERTGIDEQTLRELEAGEDLTPTLRILQRYAEALGQRFVLGLVEAKSKTAENRPAAELTGRREAG